MLIQDAEAGTTTESRESQLRADDEPATEALTALQQDVYIFRSLLSFVISRGVLILSVKPLTNLS